MNIEELRGFAEQGDANAQYELGEYFDSENNFDEAFCWYLLAAKQGHAKAQYAVADCYEIGLGAEVDLRDIPLVFARCRTRIC